MSYRLGIDFGTSHTVGFLASPDNRIRPLLFDGSPFLPSAVCATADGGLVVGGDALANAPAWPERFEPTPKRRVIERSVRLGKFEYPVPALVGALLHRMARRAVAVAGSPPEGIVCTYPASWGEARRGVLTQAARIAGLGEVLLVDEPSAAAAAIFTTTGTALPPAHALSCTTWERAPSTSAPSAAPPPGTRCWRARSSPALAAWTSTRPSSSMSGPSALPGIHQPGSGSRRPARRLTFATGCGCWPMSRWSRRW
ncbi:MAG: Hsp70 family protein [Micromonosporaceae bacterium]|nr:Hsp70 family protein [Micromonosporaceae bacterium]